MAVYVKVSDVIKLLKEIRNDGYKEVSFLIDEEGDLDEDMPPAIVVNALDRDGFIVDYGEVPGHNIE